MTLDIIRNKLKWNNIVQRYKLTFGIELVRIFKSEILINAYYVYLSEANLTISGRKNIR